jgi:hypothetical protein
MCRILGRKLPGPEMKVLESGTRLGDEGSPGTDRLVTDSAKCSNLTGVSSLSLFLCHHTEPLQPTLDFGIAEADWPLQP